MPRGKSPTERPAELRYALRWLRHRLRLPQAAVAEIVAAEGGPLSLRYYQLIEAGEKHPSPELLQQILRALQSDQDELAGLLRTRPWEAEPASRYLPSRVLPRPKDYRMAAERSLAEAGPDGTWSTSVDVAARAPAPAPPPPGTAPETRAILAELELLVPLLSPREQLEVLDLARRLRGRGATAGP